MYSESLGMSKFVMSQQVNAAKMIVAKYSRFRIMPRDRTARVIDARQILYWYIFLNLLLL